MKLRSFFQIEHLIIAIFSLLILQAFISMMVNIRFLSPVAKAVEEFTLTDFFYQVEQVSGKEIVSNELTIVDVKEQHDRCALAQTIEDINAHSPLLLAADVIFESRMADEAANALLTKQIAATPNYVGAMLLGDYVDSLNTFTSAFRSFFSSEVNHAEGYTNLNLKNYAGNLRRLTVAQTLNADTVYSFPAVIASAVRGGLANNSTINDRLIDYHNYRFPIVSYDSVALYPELMANRIVLLGSTTESRDMYYTPIGLKSGVEVQAYSVMTLLTGTERYVVGPIGIMLISLFVCYVMSVIHQAFIGWSLLRKNPLVEFLTKSKLMLRLLSFIWMAICAYAGFVLYMYADFYVPLEFVISAIVFVTEARNILIGLIKAVQGLPHYENFMSSSFLLK